MFYWPIYDNNCFCLLTGGRDEVFKAYNHEEEISESTSRKWLESYVSMFDSLKIGLRRT